MCREVGFGRMVRVSLLLTVWFAEWQPEHLVPWPWGRHGSPVRQALFPALSLYLWTSHHSEWNVVIQGAPTAQ